MVERPISPLSPEALERYRAGETLKKNRSREVCVCGHSMNFHTEVGERTVCSPAKMRCKCVKGRAILEASNLRMFMYSTSGIGSEHALGKGLTASVAHGASFTWVGGEGGPATCDICLEKTLDPIPVAVDTLGGQPSTISTGVDKVVCEGCYLTWATE